MPFDPNNPPEKLKNLTDKKKRQWVAVFNSCYEKHKDDALCHKMAWGAVKKSSDDGKKSSSEDVAERVARGFAVYAYLWLRIGNTGDYEQCDDLKDAAERCSFSGIIGVDRWRDSGFETTGFTGYNYISMFWGDDSEQPDKIRDLKMFEKKQFEMLLERMSED